MRRAWKGFPPLGIPPGLSAVIPRFSRFGACVNHDEFSAPRVPCRKTTAPALDDEDRRGMARSAGVTPDRHGQRLSEPVVSMAARPASNRATGTRNGEHDT